MFKNISAYCKIRFQPKVCTYVFILREGHKNMTKSPSLFEFYRVDEYKNWEILWPSQNTWTLQEKWIRCICDMLIFPNIYTFFSQNLGLLHKKSFFIKYMDPEKFICTSGWCQSYIRILSTINTLACTNTVKSRFCRNFQYCPDGPICPKYQQKYKNILSFYSAWDIWIWLMFGVCGRKCIHTASF